MLQRASPASARRSCQTLGPMPTVPRASLSNTGAVVVLNGASSSGKTSLARELQHRLARPFLHLQLDAFRQMEPPGYFAKDATADCDVRVAALCRSMNAAVVQFVAHGQSVLFDHVLTPDAWAYLYEDLADSKVFLVGVHCSPEELMRREARRGDRRVGLSASQVSSIHAGRTYDFTVDTTAETAAALADRLAQWLASEPVPFAFASRATLVA
jgi:chloramphenicol 3-O phosphotransferase